MVIKNASELGDCGLESRRIGNLYISILPSLILYALGVCVREK
jgi:hypothetical protein